MKKQSATAKMAVTGLMAALVFVGSMLQITIPLSTGATRVHLGNIFCLLAGLLLGGMRGGLAAGLGSFFFDLLNPIYLPDSPFTFAFKFLMGFSCGKIARLRGAGAESAKQNLIATAAGQLLYLILYVGKGFLEDTVLMHMELSPALTILVTKLGASSVNAIIAVLVSVPLAFVIRKALHRSHLLGDLD